MKFIVIAIVLMSAIMVKVKACDQVKSAIMMNQTFGFNAYPHDAEIAEALLNYKSIAMKNFSPETAYISLFDGNRYQLMITDDSGAMLYDFTLEDTKDGCLATHVRLPEYNTAADDMLLSFEHGGLVIDQGKRALFLVSKE